MFTGNEVVFIFSLKCNAIKEKISNLWKAWLFGLINKNILVLIKHQETVRRLLIKAMADYLFNKNHIIIFLFFHFIFSFGINRNTIQINNFVFTLFRGFISSK